MPMCPGTRQGGSTQKFHLTHGFELRALQIRCKLPSSFKGYKRSFAGPLLTGVEVGTGTSTEPLWVILGRDLGNLRSEVRSLRLLETPSLPSGQGTWTRGLSAQLWAHLHHWTHQPRRVFSRPPGTWLLRAGTVLQLCSQGMYLARFTASANLPLSSAQARVTLEKSRCRWLWEAREKG